MSRKPGYRGIIDRAIFKMALALCLPTFFVANAQHSSEHGQRQYAYDTADVSLEGKLVEKSAYGPPGFGETPKKDLLEKFLVIRVDHPFTVRPSESADPNHTANLDRKSNVTEVQLFLSNIAGQAFRRDMLGKAIVATGTLNESITGSQHTKVWLETKSLVLAVGK